MPFNRNQSKTHQIPHNRQLQGQEPLSSQSSDLFNTHRSKCTCSKRPQTNEQPPPAHQRKHQIREVAWKSNIWNAIQRWSFQEQDRQINWSPSTAKYIDIFTFMTNQMPEKSRFIWASVHWSSSRGWIIKAYYKQSQNHHLPCLKSDADQEWTSPSLDKKIT